jgi:exopolysaccharide biosynthesis polyprenyl glycosylphosphotransferase
VLYRRAYKETKHGRHAVLLVGAGQVGTQVVDELRKYAWADINLVGYVDDDPQKIGQEINGLRVLGSLDSANDLVKQLRVQDAVIALPLDAHDRLVEICEHLQKLAVRVHVIPDLFALSFPSATLDGFGGIPVIDLGMPSIHGTRRLAKRVFDTFVVCVGGLIVIPVCAVIAVLIELDSTGPVFYKQERIGENGHPFTMYKFRSMRMNNDTNLHKVYVTRLIEENIKPQDLGAGVNKSLKMEHDPRITRVGRFIRKTSLDELPQLINVLHGEMSLVGPRPPLAYEVAIYKEWHMRRLEAMPGITGLWQVEGRNRVSFDEMVRIDLEYIKRQSLWLDIKILLQTPWALFSARGAG